jgi:hypothetical protein
MLEGSQPMGASDSRMARSYLVAGYTRFFSASDTGISTADAVNAGLGFDLALRDDLSLRLEVRGRYTPAGGSSGIVLRIGLTEWWSLQ